MNILTDPLLELNNYRELIEFVSNNTPSVLASGIMEAQKSHFVNALMSHLERPSLIVTFSDASAKEIFENMQFFLKNSVKYYPARDIIFYNSDVHSIDIDRERLKVIEGLIDGSVICVVLTVEALLDRLMDITGYANNMIAYQVGDVISKDKLIYELLKNGYKRTELVGLPGQFAVRGGIVDIFPSTKDFPVRIEYWGDEIDSIRLIDASNQRSIENLQSFNVFPMSGVIIDENNKKDSISRIEAEYRQTMKNFQNEKLYEYADNLRESIGNDIRRMSDELGYNQYDKFISYFFDKTVSFIDFLSSDTLIFFDEPLKIQSNIKSVLSEFKTSIHNRIKTGYMLPSQCDLVYSYSDILNSAMNHCQILLMAFEQHISDFNIDKSFSFSVKGTAIIKNNIDVLSHDLKYYKKNNYKTIILAGQKSRALKLSQELLDRDINVSLIDGFVCNSFERGQIYVCRGSLHKGFMYDSIKYIIISDKEIFGDDKKKRNPRSKNKSSKIENFSDLKIGDYVVHENHGIGKYQGIEKIAVSGISKDYFKILYADNGVLYVPTSHMDIIQRYIGGDNVQHKLNKLGGSEWTKAKSKVRKAASEIASDLIKLYAKRQKLRGYMFDKDNILQREFESLFPYEETQDQLIAIEEVKKDMESNKVMDRLICGDVGFGKTEIAIRAAFKAVQNGKQVAYLVPTTILAKQHYNTFNQRMNDFSISVHELSRLKSPSEQLETINGLAAGTVDIVIGTHRLISPDVSFRNLGLVIIDEEQRFGVKHKEKLKKLKENVDMLTLSATPIPRTLHMSIINIRDMSVLEEPPLQRQPIQTYVMEYNKEFVRDAIKRELARGGQVYYLNNRVFNILETTHTLKSILPDVRIDFAHGQLNVHKLEEIMFNFINGEIDVLVCTTIIETGLDIPNVNTIIIQDADRMGLAQLYQLRGRVGRSNKIAYAYLMYKKEKVLQELAEKRLQTIREFTEFGSGFKIAMRDLELRGAGNLLGDKQHGHMDAVGYELYCKLLEEEINKQSGIKVEEKVETSIDFNINAYIPPSYIKDEEQKLEIYKKIAHIKNYDDCSDVQEELEDRFGNPPKSVKNLLSVALLKAIAQNCGVTSISEKRNNIIIMFDKKYARINEERLINMIKEGSNKILYTDGVNPYISVKPHTPDVANMIEHIKNLLQDLQSLNLNNK